MRFSWTYAISALVLFGIELFIALHVHDRFVRPFIGDALVVMLLFFAVAAVWRVRPVPLALGVLAFAFVIEAGQAAHLTQRLGLERHLWARLILGTTFQWEDLMAYVIGAAAASGIHAFVERPGSR